MIFLLSWWNREWWRALPLWCDLSSSPAQCSGSLTEEPACTSPLKSSRQAGQLHSTKKQTALEAASIPKVRRHVHPCFESVPWKNATLRKNLIPLLLLGNQLRPHICSKLYCNMLGILSNWEADVCSHFRHRHSFQSSNLQAVNNDGNTSPRRTKMNRLLSLCHKNNQGCVVCPTASSCSLRGSSRAEFHSFLLI